MHAAGSGRAAVFTKLFYAIQEHMKAEVRHIGSNYYYIYCSDLLIFARVYRL